LTVQISDTASDLESLEVCWDTDVLVDSNSDGNFVNDCESQGMELTTAWTTRGIRQITATVTDDDGAQAMTSVNISVQNLPPAASITNSSNIFELVEGDNITLSGLTSRETAGDKLTLQYEWDSDLIDSNLDGDYTGEVDFTGPEYTLTNLEPGQWTFTLTVTDDDSETSSTSITLTVAEKPAEGFVESISAAIGSVPTAIIGGLAFIVVILAGFLLLTRGRKDEEEKYSSFGNIPSTEPPMANAQSQYAMDAPAAAQPQPDMYAQPAPAADIYAQQPDMYAQPAPAADPYAQPAPIASASDALAAMSAFAEPTVQQPVQPVPVQTGPALPSSGLPDGWTMEQWQHYGEQYLAAQMGQSTPAQPATNNTPSVSASTDMSGLLDDLDL
jgi:hypothetical protein